MSAAVVEGVNLVHATPGRARVRLPGWSGRGQRGLEARLRRIKGVLGARANPLTGNVLIRFDPAATDEGSVLASLEELGPELGGLPEDGPEPPPAQSPRRARAYRAGAHSGAWSGPRPTAGPLRRGTPRGSTGGETGDREPAHRPRAGGVR